MQVLADKGLAKREIARQLKVTEGTVRYHERRRAQGATDGRAGQAQKAAALAEAVDAWRAAHGEGNRPMNVRELYEHLASSLGYEGSYKSVLRYVRRRFGKPKIRTYRRVETLPGAQSQTDWGSFPRVRIGGEEQDLYSFVMSLSFSRMPAIVWSAN